MARNAAALVIGISNYLASDRIPGLPYAVRDAQEIERVLKSPLCGFAANRVTCLTNQRADRDAIVESITEWLPKVGQDAEIAVLYFAGHGTVQTVGGAEEGMLLAYDANPDQLAVHGVSMQDVSRWIEGIGAKSVIVILDCCHAGQILPRESNQLDAVPRNIGIQPDAIQSMAGEGRFLIASCHRGQLSYESPQRQHGIFTYHLLEGIRGKGDRDGDKKVGISELFEYVALAVEKDSQQNFGAVQQPWTSATGSAGVYISEVRPWDEQPPPVKPDPQITYCAVLSESGEPNSDDSFKKLILRFPHKAKRDFKRAFKLPLAEQPIFLNAADVVHSSESWGDAVKSIVQSDLAFFDVTNHEPAVMLLLGIRAVARRGVTICSTAAEDVQPWHLKDVRVLPHVRTSREPDPLLALVDRAREGLERLQNRGDHYSDLPCYDVVRRVATPCQNPPIAYTEQTLLLCPFSSAYSETNWNVIRQDLQIAIEEVYDEDDSAESTRPGEERIEPRIVRSLDLTAPDLVSNNLFEAIRRSDFCVIDWTGWRSNVFFEFGVRLATNELDPVCIIPTIEESLVQALIRGKPPESSEALSPFPPEHVERVRSFLTQCENLFALFPVVTYSPSGSSLDPFYAMVRKHLQFRHALTQSMRPDHLRRSGFTYHTVWDNIPRETESVATPIFQRLMQAGQHSAFDATEGQSPFVYPPNHELTREAEKAGREQLIAAWLYLHYRMGKPKVVESEELLNAYRKLGRLIVRRFTEADETADIAFAAMVESELAGLPRRVSTEKPNG